MINKVKTCHFMTTEQLLLIIIFLTIKNSLTGFRGHTQKQHSQNLRASDHRIASIPNAEPVITSTSAMSFTDQSFGNVFSAYLESTLTNITNDPFISNPQK
jgi:hypothetical protein